MKCEIFFSFKKEEKYHQLGKFAEFAQRVVKNNERGGGVGAAGWGVGGGGGGGRNSNVGHCLQYTISLHVDQEASGTPTMLLALIVKPSKHSA